MPATALFHRTCATLLCAGAVLHPLPASAQQGANAWATLATTDIDFAVNTIRQQSISAVYPAPDAFARQIAASR